MLIYLQPLHKDSGNWTRGQTSENLPCHCCWQFSFIGELDWDSSHPVLEIVSADASSRASHPRFLCSQLREQAW